MTELDELAAIMKAVMSNTPAMAAIQSLLTEQEVKPMEENEFASVERKINEILDANSETFMLQAPMSLTVLKKDGKYAKASHMGGEDFKPVKAYHGKRGNLIFVFRPVMVASYDFMEMGVAEATQNLLGFKPFYRDSIEAVVGEEMQAMKEVREKQASAKMHEDRASKYDEYGSW